MECSQRIPKRDQVGAWALVVTMLWNDGKEEWHAGSNGGDQRAH